MNTHGTNDSTSGPPNEAEARRALRRLADRANTEPTRALGTYEMATQTANDVDRPDRFEWRRLAVAASIVALAAGGVVALNLRNNDSGIASAPVDPIPTDAGQGDAAPSGNSLGAGFEGQAVGMPEAPYTTQYQYALDAEHPETSAWLAVTTLGPSGSSYSFNTGDLAPVPDPGSDGDIPETAPTTAVDGDVQTTDDWPDGNTVPGSSVAATVPPPVDSLEPVVSREIAGCSTSGEAADDGGLDLADADVDVSTCQGVRLTTIDGNDVAVASSGLDTAQIETVMANIVPADDGFGYEVDPAGLPDGFSEIAAGALHDMFVPRSAVDAPDPLGLVWTPTQGDGANNPVLGQSGVEQATVVAVFDEGVGLAGQRLGFGEVSDATVGGDAAVVQVRADGTVAVIWRHDEFLLSYVERGPGADLDGSVKRANQLTPFIVASVGGVSTTVPATTDNLDWCYAIPTTMDLDTMAPDGSEVPPPTVVCVDPSSSVPTSDEPTIPATTEPDHHGPTSVPTTETTPVPPTYDDGGTGTTAIPNWPTPTTSGPYPSDPTATTAIPDYGGGVPETVPDPGQ